MTEIQSPQPAPDLLVQALEDIIEPFAYIERTLPEGYRLDGLAALQQINSREFYTRIAKEALAAHRAAAIPAPEGADVRNALAELLDECISSYQAGTLPKSITWDRLTAAERALRAAPAPADDHDDALTVAYMAGAHDARRAAPAPQAAPADHRADWWGRMHRAVAAVEAAQAAPAQSPAEGDANARDAARYRWLRDEAHDWDDAKIVELYAGPDFERLAGDDLDDAVDREMGPHTFQLDAHPQPKHTNPNNCQACDHKRHPDGGWCYMFRNEPAGVCAKHTARTSPQAPAVGAGWRPIETAPQDGRTLLLGYPNAAGKWRTVRGQWMSADYIADNWEDPDSGEPGWYETAVEAEDIPNCWPVSPTRWMPLPPAPECFSQPPVQGSKP